MTPADALERHRDAVRGRLLRAADRRADPESVTWKVNREIIVIAGWGRAILMQLAHPLIAAGVGDHSSFRGGLGSGVRRLSSTVGAMLALTFGSEEDAIDVAARINGIHDRVSGQLGEPVGSLDASARYSAHDPELLRWVHATLLESIPLTYELVVAPLNADERDRYCAEAAIMEPLLDIPAGFLPRTAAELDAYVRDMLSGDRLAVSARSRALARAILFPPGWRLLWPIFRPLQLMTIGTLPPAIRERYGFSWTPRDARALDRWATTFRVCVRALPAFVREWPAARRRPVSASFLPVAGSSPRRSRGSAA